MANLKFTLENGLKKGEEILQKSCWQNKKTIRSAVKIC